MTKTVPTGPAVSFTGAVKAFGPLRAVDGVGVGVGAVAALTAWLLASASYAVSSYRRAARTA